MNAWSRNTRFENNFLSARNVRIIRIRAHIWTFTCISAELVISVSNSQHLNCLCSVSFCFSGFVSAFVSRLEVVSMWQRNVWSRIWSMMSMLLYQWLIYHHRSSSILLSNFKLQCSLHVLYSLLYGLFRNRYPKLRRRRYGLGMKIISATFSSSFWSATTVLS